MQTLSVCSTKGGSGKSLISISLAAAAAEDGQRVALIDIDPQQSMSIWWEDRGEPENPILVTWKQNLGVRYLPTAIEKVAAAGYDLLIIDTPPAIMDIIQLAVDQADFVLIPTQASSADLAGNKAVMELVARSGRDFAFIVNRAEPRDAMVGETIKFLKDYGAVIEPPVGNRKVYRTSFGIGKSAAEVDRGKPRDEIMSVWRAVKKKLRAVARKAA